MPSVRSSTRTPIPNPRLFGDDFINTQVSKITWLDELNIAPSSNLKYGLNWFKTTGCTKLIEWSRTGMILTQMLAKAELKKHGALAKQTLLKEFAQLNDRGYGTSGPLQAIFGKKCTALGMVNLIKEKRDHTEEHPHFKGWSCINGKPQQPLYANEETAPPTMSLDAFVNPYHWCKGEIWCGLHRCSWSIFTCQHNMQSKPNMGKVCWNRWKRKENTICTFKKGTIWMCQVSTVMVWFVLIYIGGIGFQTEPLWCLHCVYHYQW